MKNEAPQLPHGPLSDRPFRILVVDDDSEAAGVVVAALEHLGYTAVRCAHAQEALRVIPSEKFDLLLIDYRMPDMTGLDLVTALRQDQCKTPVIMMTGHAATENRVPTEGPGRSRYSQETDLPAAIITGLGRTAHGEHAKFPRLILRPSANDAAHRIFLACDFVVKAAVLNVILVLLEQNLDAMKGAASQDRLDLAVRQNRG